MVIPFLLILIFNGTYLLTILYGEEYRGAYWYLIGITVTQLFQCYRMQFEYIFNSINKPRQTTKTSLISVIFNVLTAPILVLQFGGLGVIYSTILSEIIRLILYEYQVKNIFNKIIIPKGTVIQFSIFSGLYIFILLFDKLTNSSDIIFLITSSTIILIIFYSFMYMLSPETREIVREYTNESN